jgi:acyl-CoA synthetase (AMP-forming)/AMP-acid ligase II
MRSWTEGHFTALLGLPPDETLPGLLARHLECAPERPAVVLVTPRGELTLGVGQLLQGSARYAARYREAGIGKGDVIVDLLPPGPDLLFAFLGGVILGAVPSILPFPTEKLDPALYRENLAQLMEVTRPAGLIAEPGLAEELRRGLPPRLGKVAVFERGAEGPEDVTRPGKWEGLGRRPEEIVLLQHSSGTTGLQKGVSLSHQAVLNQLRAYVPALRMTPDDVIVSWLPLYHDMGLIAGFLLPLLVGVKLVLLSPFDWTRAPWRLMRAVSEHRGTLTWLPNFAYNLCAQKSPDDKLEGVDLSSWRAVINCSEPMYADSHRAFLERFQPFGLRPEALATCYAMAENVFAVTQGGIDGPMVCDLVDADQLETAGRATPASPSSRRSVECVSAGPPLPNCRVEVWTPEGGRLGPREIGELAVRSDCMLTGYYNRPDATAEVLRDGFYRTGDLGYVADGQVYITGRKKDVMILAGRNVYPQDLERLINRVPGVHAGRAVVFGVFNPKLGTEDAGAVVEVEPGGDPARLAYLIREAVATGSDVVLRHLKLVDDRWLIKTSSGKLARAANRDKFLAEQGR